MLGKLIKYDLKALFKYFIPMSIFILVYSCIGTLLFSTTDYRPVAKTSFGNILVTLVIGIYVVTCISYFLVTQGIVVVNFYKSMVTDTGYLTHTLPVKKSTILCSKAISAFIILILSYIMFFICLAIMLDVPAILVQNHAEIDRVIADIQNSAGPFMIIRGTFAIIFATIAGLFQNIAMYFLAIALGQLMNRHKAVGSLVSYFGIVLALQVISSIVSFIIGNAFVTFNIATVNSLITIIIAISLFVLILTAIMLFLTHYIFKNKLNLE